MTEKDLIGKTIESIEVDGYGIEMRFTDGAVFVYYASDGGYSSWEIEDEAHSPDELEEDSGWVEPPY